MVDVSAYLQRIEYDGALEPDLSTLNALHVAHAAHIPFENLDILLGRQISLDIADLQSKLIKERRGGYCFEQNTLFAAVLRELGYSVTSLAARVRQRQRTVLPRTHMCLRVCINDVDWIADVGFGGEGLLMPVPMSGEAAAQFLWTYRLTEEAPGTWVMQSAGPDSWNDLYVVTLEPQEHVDFEMANYYVSTHPESRFVRTLTVQLLQPGCRRILRNRELVTDSGNEFQKTVIEDDKAMLEVLSRNFGLDFPTGTRFTFEEEV